MLNLEFEFEFVSVFKFLFFNVLLLLVFMTIIMLFITRFLVNTKKDIKPKVSPRNLQIARALNYAGFVVVLLPLLAYFVLYAVNQITWQYYATFSFFELLPVIIWFLSFRSIVFISLGTNGQKNGGVF